MAKRKRNATRRQPAAVVAAPPRAPLAVSDNDQRIAREALAKRSRGERLTQIEERALARVNKERERVQRWEYYRTIPKGDWVKLSGRPVKVLNEQAGRYGMPVGGPTIDLVSLAGWLHQFIADNAKALAAGALDDPLMAGNSEGLERYRNATADIREMERDVMRNLLLKRAEVHSLLMGVGGLLRKYQETIERRQGREARDQFEPTLDAIEKLIDPFIAGDEAEDS